jgi:transcriptional regulator with XRE-family HTH domain
MISTMVGQVVDIERARASYARRLKAARKRLGLTQQETAYMLGVAIRTYQLWEGGKQLPEGENAYIVQVKMGVPLVASSNRTTGRNPGQPERPTPERTLEVASA